MKKSDLRTGHIVTTRKGEEYVVYLGIDAAYTDSSGCNDVLVRLVGIEKAWNLLNYYNEDLTCYDGSIEWDIVKVERGTHPYCLQAINFEKNNRQTIWERKEEPKEMTVAEIEKLLGYPVKIVK